MTLITLPRTIVPGTPENAAHVQENDEAIRDVVNGSLDGDNLTATTASRLGLSSSSITRSGVLAIVTQETRTSATYGLMTTADRIQNVALPTNGLLHVLYQAEWWETVAGAARAAIFIGTDQLRALGGASDGAPIVQEALKGGGSVGTSSPLGTNSSGLSGQGGSVAFARGSMLPVIAGGDNAGAFGAVVLEAPAGTYTVSIQFKASSGDVVVRNRKLRVWAHAL
jgi:hypothetical protein